MPSNYSLHQVTADTCQEQRWPATKAFGEKRSKMTDMDPPRLRWGSEVHQRKRKREKITFEATETESSNWLFFFSLINCTGSTSALAEPARTLHLPITSYLGEVEEPAKPSCSPPSYLPCGTSQFSAEGVFKVRNRRSEAKIGSNQSWASASPTEEQMGGEAADDATGKLPLFISIMDILVQPCLNVLLLVAGALGKLLQLFPPQDIQTTPLLSFFWTHEPSKERLLPCCSGLTDPQGHPKAMSWLDNPKSISSWLRDILLQTQLIFLRFFYQQLPQLSVAHTITSGKKIKIVLFNCRDISVNYL